VVARRRRRADRDIDEVVRLERPYDVEHVVELLPGQRRQRVDDHRDADQAFE
jgi:hypothetical protein